MGMFKKISLSVMTFTYLFAGIAHFTRFDYFLSLEPSFMPQPRLVVTAVGTLLILLSFFLPFRATSRWACYGALFILSVSVPIDLYIWWIGGAGVPLPTWMLALRAPFHLLLMLWAFWHSRPSPQRR